MDSEESHSAAKTKEYVNKQNHLYSDTNECRQDAGIAIKNRRKFSVQATAVKVWSQLHKAFAYNSIY